jgi:hypothetical protein
VTAEAATDDRAKSSDSPAQREWSPVAAPAAIRDAISSTECLSWAPSPLVHCFPRRHPLHLEPSRVSLADVPDATRVPRVELSRDGAIIDCAIGGAELRWRSDAGPRVARLPPGRNLVPFEALGGALRFDVRSFDPVSGRGESVNVAFVRGSTVPWLEVVGSGDHRLVRVRSTLPGGEVRVYRRAPLELAHRSRLVAGASVQLPGSAIVAVAARHADDLEVLDIFVLEGDGAPAAASHEESDSVAGQLYAAARPELVDAPARASMTTHARTRLDAIARLLAKHGSLSPREAFARTYASPAGAYRYLVVEGIARRYSLEKRWLTTPAEQTLAILESFPDLTATLAAYVTKETVDKLERVAWRQDLWSVARAHPIEDVRAALERTGSAPSRENFALALRGLAVVRRARAVSERLRAGSPLEGAVEHACALGESAWRQGSEAIQTAERTATELEERAATPSAPPSWLGPDAPGEPETTDVHPGWQAAAIAARQFREKVAGFLSRLAGGDAAVCAPGTVDHGRLMVAVARVRDLVGRTTLDARVDDASSKETAVRLADSSEQIHAALGASEPSPSLARALGELCAWTRENALAWAAVLQTIASTANGPLAPSHRLFHLVAPGERFSIDDAPRVADLLRAARIWHARGATPPSFADIGDVPADLLRAPDPSHAFLAELATREAAHREALRGSVAASALGDPQAAPVGSMDFAETLGAWWHWLSGRAAWHRRLIEASAQSRERCALFAEHLGPSITWVAMARASDAVALPWLDGLLNDEVPLARLSRLVSPGAPGSEAERERAERLLHANARAFDRSTRRAIDLLTGLLPYGAPTLAPSAGGGRGLVEAWLRSLVSIAPNQLPAALALAPAVAKAHPWTPPSDTEESRRLANLITRGVS